MARRRGSQARAWISGELDREDLARLLDATRDLEGGARLREAFARRMRDAVRPSQRAAQAAIRSMPSRGTTPGESLRSAIADEVKISVRTSAPTPSVRLYLGQPNVRRFKTAPRRTQDSRWRHPVFGNREVWVNQPGKRDWFGKAARDGRDRYVAAAGKVLDDFRDIVNDALR